MEERIKERRRQLGISQEQLAKTLGITKGSISQWERGATKPRGQNLFSLAQALQVPASWLLGETDDIELHDIDAVEDDAPASIDEVELPLFREVEFAAGNGATQVVENHGRSIKFSIAKLEKAGVSAEAAACATVKGDSMEPRIPEGATIAIDKSDTKIRDGRIYALDHGGLLRVKKLYRMPMGQVRIVSENSVDHPDEFYKLGDHDAPNIIGRVFWWESFDV